MWLPSLWWPYQTSSIKHPSPLPFFSARLHQPSPAAHRFSGEKERQFPMEADKPGKPAKFPHITVVISGITSEPSNPNADDAPSMSTNEEGDPVVEQGGVVVHKDVAGILSRRTLALEVRIDKIEQEIRTLKSNFNGRLTRIEDKMKTLLKGQEEILSKMEELERVRPVAPEADGGPSVEQSSDTHVADEQELQRTSKRKRADEYLATSSIVARVLRARYRRPVKQNSRSGARSKSSLVRYYKRMRAKQAESSSEGVKAHP